MRAFNRGLGRRSLVAIAAFFLFASANVGAEADPPGRVASLSYASGSVSFGPAGSGQWIAADFNRPLTTGDSLWVPRAGRAELHIGSAAVRLNEQTSLSFLTLTDDVVQLKLTQGDMVVRVRSLSGKESFEIDTPNLAFSVQEPGEYKITVNDDNTTTVAVRRGAGVAYGDHDSITLREAEQATFFGTNLSHASIARMSPYDSFDAWANERGRAEDASVSAQYLSREVIGYQQLDAYGTWETHVEYGAIWTPRITVAGWAPYRVGHWLWVAPWGWTWVDHAPWGFAPYHYGRWAYIGTRWAWVPGHHLRHAVPVYAPALVAFVGVGGMSAGIGVTSGRAHVSAVAWLPLGPGEAYRPGYAASSRYVDNINRNATIVDRNRTVYANQGRANAVTAVAAAVFAAGQAVAPAASTLNSQQLSNAQIGAAAPSVAPSSGSLLGVARRVAAPEVGQFAHRPVVATMKPADVPALQQSLAEPVAPKAGMKTQEAGAGAVFNQIAPDARAIAPAAVGTASGIVLHNAVRPGYPGGATGAVPGRTAAVVSTAEGRTLAVPGGVPTPQTVVPGPVTNRPRPEQTEGLERYRSGATLLRRDETPDEERHRSPSDKGRALPNAPAAIRSEIHQVAPVLPANSSMPRENASPVQTQRNVERPVAATQESVRQIMPRDAGIAPMPHVECASGTEQRKEGAAGPVKLEKERERKERSDQRNSQGLAK